MDESVRKAFTDAWNLYKKYAGMPPTDDAWEKLIAEGDKIIKENNKSPFIKALVLAVNDELGRKAKDEPTPCL